MKKVLFLMTLLVMGVSFAFAQTNADIKFDKTTHDFGKFSENSPVVSCTFSFMLSPIFSYLASLAVMSPSIYSLTISVLALVRRVIDFLKCPGYLPVPL